MTTSAHAQSKPRVLTQSTWVVGEETSLPFLFCFRASLCTCQRADFAGPLEMAEGETTGAAEFSGAQLDAIAGVVQRIVDKAFSERSGGVAAEGGAAGAGRASAEGTTTAQTGESELKQ